MLELTVFERIRSWIPCSSSVPFQCSISVLAETDASDVFPMRLGEFRG